MKWTRSLTSGVYGLPRETNNTRVERQADTSLIVSLCCEPLSLAFPEPYSEGLVLLYLIFALVLIQWYFIKNIRLALFWPLFYSYVIVFSFMLFLLLIINCFNSFWRISENKHLWTKTFFFQYMNKEFYFVRTVCFLSHCPNADSPWIISEWLYIECIAYITVFLLINHLLCCLVTLQSCFRQRVMLSAKLLEVIFLPPPTSSVSYWKIAYASGGLFFFFFHSNPINIY